MTVPKTLDLAAMKTGGLIKQKTRDHFAVRLRVPIGRMSADELTKIGEVAKRYGSGYVHLTVRQGMEIQDVPFSDLQTVRDELEAAGIRIGACGPRFRVVTACPGREVCPNGLVDTMSLGMEADERFYGEEMGLNLPHKFKVTFAGCTSCCPKPQENDVGFHGQVEPELFADECNGCGICEVTCLEGAIKMNADDLPERDDSKCIYCGDCVNSCPTDAWKVKRRGLAAYAGGRWGRHPELGKKVGDFVEPEQAMDFIAKTLQFYKTDGRKGERLGVTINRLGLDYFKEKVL